MMDLSVTFPLNSGVRKNLFKLKPSRADGLRFNIHHSQPNKKIRFVRSCFNENGQIIVSADNEGNFYVVDHCSCKFWSLPKFDSCTFVKFSIYNFNHLLTGLHTGDILIVNVESGLVCGQLVGHKFPVKYVSYSEKNLCLSTSQYESILWDLHTNTKLQVLNLEKNNTLKLVVFVPASCYILACFQDDLIHVWNNTDFETVKQFLPINWNNYAVRSITFSRNGQIMVVAGYLPILAVFRLDTWNLTKLIDLPEYIHTVKCVEFVSSAFDGGCNKILAILSGQGVIYFYDIEQNVIVSELISKCEITKMVICPKGNHVACVLCLGEVEVYNLGRYVSPSDHVMVKIVGKKSNVQRKRCVAKIGDVKQEIELILDVDKLKSILKLYGQYPEVYRLKIWEKLLSLPNNYRQYNNMINNAATNAFERIYATYSSENKLTLKNLKKLLNNLTTWCPFFLNVDYLTGFALAFVKALSNKPVVCFEVVSTVIINWCQHWFEYFPLPPLNVLAMIDNLLYEHDPELLHHFTANKLPSGVYTWSLLRTGFSDVLAWGTWLQLWDHVFTNEPTFLLCSAAAYNHVHRNVLLSLHRHDDFECFYRRPTTLNVHKFLRVCYRFLDTTSPWLHPRQYLQKFRALDVDDYPVYTGYPKTQFEFQTKLLREMDDELEKVVEKKVRLRDDDGEILGIEDRVVREEQERRLRELEQTCLRKLRFKKELLGRERKKLEEMQSSIGDRNRVEVRKSSPNTDGNIEDLISIKEQYLLRLKELLKYKYRFKELLRRDSSGKRFGGDNFHEAYSKQLENEIDDVSRSLGSMSSLKKLNIATSVEILEDLIDKIQNELIADKLPFPENDSGDKVKMLQDETKGLEKEVAKLLEMLSKDFKVLEAKNDTATFCTEYSCPKKTVRFTSSSSVD